MMKQALARALGCKQEKLKSSQFQQKGYLVTPETKVPGGGDFRHDWMQRVNAVCLCLPCPLPAIGRSPTVEGGCPPCDFGGLGRKRAGMTTSSNLSRSNLVSPCARHKIPEESNSS